MKVDFRVLLITDRRQAPRGDLEAVVEEALAGGIRAVMLREKDLPGGALYRLAERLRLLTRRFGARLLVNDRPDVALAVGADGAHLGSRSIPAAAGRRLLGSGSLLGVSTHGPGELRAAVAGGADYVTFGPVHATPSKVPYGRPVGTDGLSRACRESPVPVFALGGIGPGRAAEAIRSGAFGIALISGIVAAPDPRAAARECIRRVGEAAVAPQQEGR